MTRALIRTAWILPALLLVAPNARAEHRYSPLEAVRGLAHELEDATRDLYYAARHERHHYDGRERHALEDLYRLKDRARHFHREIERHYRDPYHTEADYLELRRAVEHTIWGRHDLHPYPSVERHLVRVDRLMEQLDAYYAEYTGYRRWDDHDRRYGHHRRGGHYEPPRRGPRFWFEWNWWR